MKKEYVTVRMSSDLRAKITEMAKADMRSVSAQIHIMLERAVQEQSNG
jgi:hypothetical protein